MPKDFLFPSVAGVSRVVNLVADRAFGADLLGSMVNLSGYTLVIESPDGNGFFIVCGPGVLDGQADVTLGEDQATMVAVSDGHFKFIDNPLETIQQLVTHAASAANPHNVTKAQIGLGSVNNTSDAEKPVSIAQQVALDKKAPAYPRAIAVTGEMTPNIASTLFWVSDNYWNLSFGVSLFIEVKIKSGSWRLSARLVEDGPTYVWDGGSAEGVDVLNVAAWVAISPAAGSPVVSSSDITTTQSVKAAGAAMLPDLQAQAPGTSAPVNEVRASVIINPSGADNSILHYSNLSGAAGNQITVAYAQTTSLAEELSVAVDDYAILVNFVQVNAMSGVDLNWSTGIRFSKTLSGNTTFTFSNATNGKVIEFYITQPGGSGWGINWPGGITWASGEPGIITAGTSIRVTFTCIGAGAYTAAFVTGVTPPVTTTAAQVITAINNHLDASALVLAIPSGVVTGAVAAVSATSLSGGADATSTPPYIRIADGKLFANDSGVWKEAVLSELPL